MTDWQTEYDEAIAAPLRAKIERLETEIERLKADWRPELGSLVEERLLDEAKIEIERLKAEKAMAKLIPMELTEGWVRFDDNNRPIWTTFQLETPDNVEDWHQITVTVRKQLDPKLARPKS